MNLIPLLTLLDIGQAFGDFLNTIMQPIYWAISGIIVGFHALWSNVLDPSSGANWVLSIISLTVVVRTAMIPLFVRQINSSRQMQLLQPKMKALQEKYGTDRERLSQEQMKLYQSEGVNPFASCLPLIVQMPIFIGLFNVLNAVSRGVPLGQFFVDHPELVTSLRESHFLGASMAGMFMPATPWGPNQWMAGALILGLTATMFVTQLHMMRKNMPPEALTGPMAQQQKMMLYIFPATYLFFGLSVPIGVMMYWFASNLWTLVQQWILIHNSPTPGTPAYVDWEERMRAKGQDPDDIVRKRAGLGKKQRVTASTEPGTVARQTVTSSSTRRRSGSSSVTSTPDAARPATQATGEPERQRIVRQQPTRGTRASRKK